MCAFLFFFFFNDTATTEIYTLSLTTLFRSARSRSWPRSRACGAGGRRRSAAKSLQPSAARERLTPRIDRKSTRLNSSHVAISYAVFCLKKKKKKKYAEK